MDSYLTCGNTKERENLLEGIEIDRENGKKNSKIGKAMSNKIYRIFTGTDPSE